jgi:hypothetical protein
MDGKVRTAALLSRPYTAPTPKTSGAPSTVASGPSIAYPMTPMP